MAYAPTYPSKINWQNEPSEATALNNVNLNKMDDAIYTIDQRVVALDTAREADETILANKVDEVAGKGLSQVDNVEVTVGTTDGTQIGSIKTTNVDGSQTNRGLYNGVVVDSALSDSSTNPVQNKAIKMVLDEKVDKVSGKGLSEIDNVSFTTHTSIGTRVATVNKSFVDGTSTVIGIYNGIVVDSALSSASENPVENKVIYDALNNLLPSKTVSGNPISISDASGLNAKALTVSMNPIQDLHGYSNPWVGGAGKNKFGIKEWFDTIHATYTQTDNEFVVTTQTELFSKPYVFSDSDIAVSLSMKSYKAITATNIRIQLLDSNNNVVYELNASADYQKAENKMASKVRFNWSAVGTFSIDEVQIELGTTATTYEPYSNICPISGRTEASVKRTGKNLFTYNTTYYNGYWTGSSSNPVFNGNNEERTLDGATGWQYVKIPVSGISSIVNSGLINNGGVNSCFLSSDDPTDVISLFLSVNNNGVKTIPSNAKYMCLCFYNAKENSSSYPNAQIEYGSTATAYEPYTAETNTKEFGQTVYGGSHEFVSGKLKNTYKTKSFNSSSSWTEASTGVFNITFAEADIDTSGQFICNKYKGKYTTTWSGLSNGDIWAYYYNGTLYIRVMNTKYSTVQEFTASTDCEIDIVYSVTGTESQLSPEALTLLKGNNVLSTDADDMELKYSVSLDSLLP